MKVLYGGESLFFVMATGRVTRLGNVSPIGLLLRFQRWFVVDVLGFQIELCCRYFWPFLTWQLFGLFLKKNWQFFSNLLVTLATGPNVIKLVVFVCS